MKEKKKNNQEIELPNVSELENELKRVNHNIRFRKLLLSTLYTLIVTAALAVLIAVFFMPVMRIYGSSMEPTLNEGEIVVSIKTKKIETYDIVGVYYGSKLLIKRCIATSGQWVDFDSDGNVYIDGVKLEEEYVSEKSIGELNIELPYQVPDNCIFVMGDHRETSIDSRNTALGAVDIDDVEGKLLLRVWPLSVFGKVK